MSSKVTEKKKISFFSHENLVGNVKPASHGDLALLFCCFVTGLIDAASFNNWEVFVGMQTGNTVILGLSTARLPSNEPLAYATTLVSLGSFFVGALLTARISALAGPLRRSTLTCNFLIQTLLIVLAAALTSTSIIPKTIIFPASLHPSPSHKDPYSTVLSDINIVAALPALALQFGGQIASSRILGYNELPTNVLTSGYADLAGDAHLFAWDNPKRNRRFAAAVLVLLGAIAGAWLQRSEVGIIGVLWIAAGLKLLVTLGIFFLMPRAEEE